MEEPMLRVWMQDSVPPTTRYKTRPGRWVAEPSWPSRHTETRRYPLIPCGIAKPDAQVSEIPLRIQSPLGVGLFAGKWCAYTAAPDLPHDQRQEDGGALVFDSAPLEQNLEILGAPIVALELTANKPTAMVAVRLSDLAPDDKATRVTYGLLNLTHRDSSEHPELLEPDRRYRVQVRLNDIAQVFPQGHRLRIAISTSYWPLAWPTPESVRLTIFAGSSTLILPVRTPRDEYQRLPAFAEPEGAPPIPITLIEPEHHNWRVIRDLEKDESTLEVINDHGIRYIEEIDMEVQRKALERYSYRGDEFNSVKGETYWERGFKRGHWSVKSITRTVLTSTKTHFRLHAELDAYEGDRRVYSDNWDSTIPRDFV
jgi:hypothetical protein